MYKLQLPALLLIFLLAISDTTQGQINHLLPVEIRKAYQTGTRSVTGKPGPMYWQNRSDYVIKAEFLPDEKLLKGEETVTYHNNSPDSLNKIVIRLYPDLFRTSSIRNWQMYPDALNEGTVINYIKINGRQVDLQNRKEASRSSTNLQLFLDNKLPPDDSLEISISWHFEIQEQRPVRTGYYGHNLFFIAYWYPQIAVYDDIDGWDQIEYTGTVEFYNDFNNFDVTIKTPAHYMIWATGKLENEADIYTTSVVKKINNARNSDQVVNIFSTEDCKKEKVLRNGQSNTWHFIAEKVPDFSFGSTDVANWDASSLLVDKINKRKVFIEAVYPDSVRTFDTVALWARNSIEYMSFELPGYPYPYMHMTLFDNGRGGGGMETPMMVNLGDAKNSANEAATAFHEIAHTYFPFFMGINERKYAWMDEGWAAYLPTGFSAKYYPEWNYLKRRVKTFENFNGREKESNLMTLSYMLSAYDTYRNHAYNRSSLAYHFLRDALNDSIFKVCLHTYMNWWHGKHPIPTDFFNTFSLVSGRDLDWFLVPWFYEKSQADQGIRKVTLDNRIVIENIGGLPLPVVLKVDYKDGTSELFYRNTSVWQTGKPSIIVQANPNKEIKDIILGSDEVPDIKRGNNQFSAVSK